MNDKILIMEKIRILEKRVFSMKNLDISLDKIADVEKEIEKLELELKVAI
jgi:hypothetical protein